VLRGAAVTHALSSRSHVLAQLPLVQQQCIDELTHRHAFLESLAILRESAGMGLNELNQAGSQQTNLFGKRPVRLTSIVTRRKSRRALGGRMNCCGRSGVRAQSRRAP